VRQRVTYLLTYAIIYSKEQSPPWEAKMFSARQEISHILWNPIVHYCVYNSPLSLSWARTIQSMPPSYFLKIHLNIILYGPNFISLLYCLGSTKGSVQAGDNCIPFVTKPENLLAPCPTPKLEDHPFSAVFYCLFNIFVATLYMEDFLHPQPQNPLPFGDRDTLIVGFRTPWPW